jgi:hypothetical protein
MSIPILFVSKKTAGEPGLEPRSKAPKASVLPLHHSPMSAKALYHRKFYVAMENEICAGAEDLIT